MPSINPSSSSQTLSEIKSLLAAYGLHPRHRFGQNFLHDASKMERIIAAAELTPGDLVLEVGPGTGALSVRLLAAGVRLVAVEIDRDLEAILRSQLGPVQGGADKADSEALSVETAGDQPTLTSSADSACQCHPSAAATLIIDDVLDGKHAINPRVYEALRAMAGSDNPSFKLVANLPYNVASPLIANLLLAPYGPQRSEIRDQRSEISVHPSLSLAVILIQREVADRLLAPPGGKDYGPLGILVQAMCEVERIATLPPGCFWPSPKVDSAVVRLRVRSTPLTRDPHGLSNLLHRLFSKRRKQIGTILGRDAVLPAGVDAQQRPEQLSVEQLVAMADAGL